MEVPILKVGFLNIFELFCFSHFAIGLLLERTATMEFLSGIILT